MLCRLRLSHLFNNYPVCASVGRSDTVNNLSIFFWRPPAKVAQSTIVRLLRSDYQQFILLVSLFFLCSVSISITDLLPHDLSPYLPREFPPHVTDTLSALVRIAMSSVLSIPYIIGNFTDSRSFCLGEKFIFIKLKRKNRKCFATYVFIYNGICPSSVLIINSAFHYTWITFSLEILPWG